MADRIFADKSKEALLEIVRLTDVMPLAEAEALSRAKLAVALEGLHQGKDSTINQEKPLQTKKSTMRKVKKSAGETKERTSENVAGDTAETIAKEDEKKTADHIAVVELKPEVKRGRGRPRKNNPDLVSGQAVIPVTDSKQEILTEKKRKKKPAQATPVTAEGDSLQQETSTADSSVGLTKSLETVEIEDSEPKLKEQPSVKKKRGRPKLKKEKVTRENDKRETALAAATSSSIEETKPAATSQPAAADKAADTIAETKVTTGEEGLDKVGIVEEQAEKISKSAPGEKTAPSVQVTLQEQVTTGVLEILPDGYGFLRCENYLPGNKDVYVPPQFIRRFNLRPGDLISGPSRVQRDNGSQAIFFIKSINGMPPDKSLRRPRFDKLVPIYPSERFKLETGRNELSTRIIDLIAPIGKGQRGMIVSPPKAGKTILLQKIANAISANNPEVKLLVLLIDERPEEVTDMQRSIQGEVVYSTFDKTPENHVKVAELVLERAMRLVELGEDVVILLDSITRLARAYNLSINPTGRTLSGGLDPGALYGPKRFFGAARNIENGGSLTIVATSLVETGSRMDEVIFEEFKGTGNMEVYLDRKLSEKRIFPALDLNRSGTRREELLLTAQELDSVWSIRKAFGQLDNMNVTEMIINLLLRTNTNDQFVSSINVSFNDKAIFDSMRGGNGGNKGNSLSSLNG